MDGKTSRTAKSVLIVVLMVAGAVAITGSSPLAEIYRYVDKEGVAYFSNTPVDEGYKPMLGEDSQTFDPAQNFGGYEPTIIRTAQKYKVDSALVKAVIKAESNFNPTAISPKGAQGLMQLMPQTAHLLHVADSFHPQENIEGGVRHLRYLLDQFGGDLQLALAAYNVGEKIVYRYNGIPPYKETREYVQRVLAYFREYSGKPRTPNPFAHSSNKAIQ